MAGRRKNIQPIIDSDRYGVSFSVKQCRAFRIEPEQTLDWLLAKGWRRFRLMSYWSEHEKQPNTYDFKELDRQIRTIRKKSGSVTLCLGVKQPRWPEYHWPDWVLRLTPKEREAVLLRYITTVVKRYKDDSTVISWQLENEALLRGFGMNVQIDRKRLRAEYKRVRQLDPLRPIIMSTSNGWGIPFRRPVPHVVGFSLYTIMFKNGSYHETVQKPWLHRLRKLVITALLRRKVFIHELQCEPWGPTKIADMQVSEQNRSMDPERLLRNLSEAKVLGAYPIDLWGGEWWYWRSLQGYDTIWETIEKNL